MKIAVFSDSHGQLRGMIAAISTYRPDLIIHLGDHARDAQAIKKQFPQIPVKSVRGNCDTASLEPETDIFLADGVRVMITHGHRQRVKEGISALLRQACAAGVGVVLYGHTHIARLEEIEGILLLNPGSAGEGKGSSYARVETAGVLAKCAIVRMDEEFPY